MSNTAAITIVLNPSEEPHFVYINNVLEMRNDKMRYEKLDPFRGYDWVTLIQKYQSFSKVVKHYELTEDAYEKFRDNVDLVPVNFDDFTKDDIYPQSDK